MYQTEDAYAARLSEDICNYIDDLIADHGLLLTVHGLEPKVSPCWYRFLPYNTHQSIYCLCVKDSPEAWQHCIDCQRKVLARARAQGAYAGVCWAGSQEAVFPLSDSKGQTVAFLSVSGYAAPRETALPRLQRASRQFALSGSKLMEAYDSLRRDMPDMAVLARMLAPLRHMITLLLDHFAELPVIRDGSTPSGQYQALRSYIARNFAQSITLADLAETTHCSYSYVSHLFKRFGSESFSQFLARIRIDAAKKYLEYTHQSMMEIASAVGYDDPNYFSAVFRRLTGCSPTVWRQANKRPLPPRP